MNITALAIKNRTTVIVLVVLVSLYGSIAYFKLPKQQDPGFTIRAAVVTARLPGASTVKMEQLVTDPIEQAILEMPELDNVYSESTPGFSFITVNFKESYTNMRPIFDALRRKMEAIDTFPDGIKGPTVNDEYGDVFGSVFALTGEGYSYAELKVVADEIKDRLLRIEDIAKVELQGIQKEEIYVEYNLAKLTETGLSPQQLSQILSGINTLTGGGEIVAGVERIALEPSGNFETLDDLKRTVIQIPGTSNIVYLEDIAEVYRAYVDPPTNHAHYTGQTTIMLSLSLREGGNILDLGQTLAVLIREIEATYPHGIQINPVFLESSIVSTSINAFVSNLLQAIAIVIVVMLVFLGLRTGLIVATLVPVTITASLLLMDVFSITLNQISLAALIISLGLLVDNAIVISESILVRRENGEQPVNAAIAAGQEMAVPLLTSSLTTSAAFLPIYLAESAVGEYTADIFKVVTIALLSSWILAITFIPLLTVTFMKIKAVPKSHSNHPPPFDTRPYQAYQSVLLLSVRHRWIFLLLVVSLFYSAIWVLQFVPNVFIPPKTDPIINGSLSLPRGTAIETTRKVVSNLEDHLQETLTVTPQQASEGHEGILNWAIWLGKSAPRYTLGLDPGASDSGTFNMLINTTTDEIIPSVIKEIQDYARANEPDLNVQLRKIENGVPIPYPVEIRVSGPDLDTLYQLIRPIKQKLFETPGISAVHDDWGPMTKKLRINIDQSRTRRAGVTNKDVATSLQTGLSGIELTQFRERNAQIPITLRSVAEDRQDIGKLENMTVYSSSSNQMVLLSQVADLDIAWQPAVIKRRNRDRTIAIQAQLLPGVTATDINQSFLPWLKEHVENWPSRYRHEFGGELETSGNANAAIAAKIPLAAMVILLLLVAQFNNVRKPLIIFTTIPLGLVGVAYGLLIAQSVFGFFTILGIVSLSGIVINNAIVLLDRINLEIKQKGLDPEQAVLSACKERLRPILLTTATTVGGMLPLWVSQDPMFETMAVAIMFGLLFATLLTLLVVPVLYSIFFRLKYANPFQ